MAQKIADPSLYPAIFPTDDDLLQFRTAAGTDGRAPLVQPKGYIDGLKLEWVSATQVRVTPGAAYVPGPKRIAELAAAVTLAPSLAASTWYHVYLTVAGGTVSAEAVTTAPAAPYTGTARAKTGDTSRRYIGSFLTNASSTVIPFQIGSGGTFDYRIEPNLAPLRCLVNGTSTTRTTVSLAAAMPITATEVEVVFTDTSANSAVYALISIPGMTGNLFGVPKVAGSNSFSLVTSPTQGVDYYYSGPVSSGLYIDVRSFKVER